jgi:hypothetical protein
MCYRPVLYVLLLSGIMILGGCGPEDYTPSEARDAIVNRGYEVNERGYATAIDSAKPKLARIYAQASIEESDLGFYPVVRAAKKGRPKVLRAILQETETVPDTSKAYQFEKAGAVGYAAYEGNLESVKVLLDNGGEASETALWMAARGGQPEVADYLLKKDAPVSPDALSQAAVMGGPDVLRRLLAAKDTIRSNKPLKMAVLDGDSTEVAELIQHGAPVNPDTVFSEAPVFEALCARAYADMEMVRQLLLDHDASPRPLIEARQVVMEIRGRPRMSLENRRDLYDCEGWLRSDRVRSTIYQSR